MGRRKDGSNHSKRQRSEVPLDSQEGKRITAELYEFFLKDKVRRLEWYRAQFAPLPYLAWSVHLLGYEQAVDSAINAMLLLKCESALFREWWTCSGGTPDLLGTVFKGLSYGFNPNNEVFDWLSSLNLGDPVAQRWRIRRALRAGREGKVVDRISQHLNGVDGSPSHCAVVFGKMQHSLRLWVPALWIMAGLWMANSEESAAYLQWQCSEPSSFAGMPIPTGETYHKWTSGLGLYRYKGRGRIAYGQHGQLLLNGPMIKEVSPFLPDAYRIFLGGKKPR